MRKPAAIRFDRPGSRGSALGRRLQLEPLEIRALLTAVGMTGADLPFETALVNWQGQERLAIEGRWIISVDGMPATQARQSSEASDLLTAVGLSDQFSVVRNLGADGVYLVNSSAAMAPSDAYARLQAIPGFREAEPDFIVQGSTTPNDPSFNLLYGLHNTGQTVNGDPGTPDADIDAPEAWNLSTGSSNVVVAIIDSGIDYTHPDLVDNIWTNPGEIPGNSIDDDGNGYVDDVHGYDFFNLDGDPFDDNSHGTHVAGTIGAEGNNGIGVAGVNWDVTLMGLKFLGSGGTGPNSAAIAAVNYVSMMSDRGVNIRVTNNSWSSTSFSSQLSNAIAGNRDRDILFVAAASNDGTNNDDVPHYPASYDLDNIIAVAATTNDDTLASFSNYGAISVDLAAPGVLTYSTTPGGGYGFKNGTSMATPHVTGAAALAFALEPNASYTEVRNAILGGVDHKANLAGVVATGGRLNLVGMIDKLGLYVGSTTPAAGSTVSLAPTDFVVNFLDAYSQASVDAEDLTVNNIAADSFTFTDSDTITFHYNSTPTATEGLQAMHIADGAIARDSDGALLHAFDAAFRFDSAPITVTSTTPADGSSPTLPLPDFDVVFSEPYQAASIDTSDLILSQGTVTGFTLVNPTTVRYHLDLQVEDTIEFSIAAGAAVDTFGNPGPGYSGSFTTDVSTVAFPTLLAVAPAGSLVYRSSYTGSIFSSIDADSFTLQIDPAQTLTVYATASVGLQSRIAISGPGVSQFASAVASGGPAVLPTVSIPGGTYTLTITGLSGSLGSYTLTALLNAALELEEVGSSSDDSIAGAQDLSAAFGSLGGNGSRAAVIGTGDFSLPHETEPNGTLPTANNATTNFAVSSGNLYQLGIKGSIGVAQDSDWFQIGQLQAGDVISITVSGTGSNRGTLSDGLVGLFSGPDLADVVALNDGDGPGLDALIYRFLITTTSTYYINTGRFDFVTGSYDLGVYLENSGPTPTTGGSLVAETEANNSGATANDASTSWRVVQYFAPTSGAISGGDADVYQYQLTAGDLLTIDAGSSDGLLPRVTLLDAAGSAIALEDGTSQGPTDSSSIYAYHVPASGSYYVKVEGASGSGSYRLNVYLSSTTAPPTATTPADTYSFSLSAGDTVTLAAKGLNGLSPNLSLLDGGGTVLAQGTAGSTNLDRVIGNFVAPASATYYARLGPNNPFDYNLIVTRNAAFDTRPNGTLASAQVIAPSSRVLGAVDVTSGRFYRLQLQAGQALTLNTTTPGDATGQFVNVVNPAVDLYSPVGLLVASNDNGAPDGRNATLVYVPPSPGSYLVQIRAVAGQGEFVLNAVGALPTVPSSVVARKLFYNQSGTSTRYDGNNLAINSLDDNAIATDKTAYLWEDTGAATFANVSSYTKGINGIMVDISGSHPSITAADFIFKVGNNNSPGLWGTANAPTSVSVRAGAGVSGSDRVEIIWTGGTAPIKQWLEVIVLANANTGLAQEVGHPAGHGDAFFFGNAVGDSGLGDTAINATVNATDENGARLNPANLAANIPVTNIYDFDRNAQVNANDQNISRLNATNTTTVVKFINLITAPAAPEADGADEGDGGEISPLVASDSGVASALTAPTTGGTPSLNGVTTWITTRLANVDLNSGAPARLFQHLHDVNTPRSRAQLQKFDAVADARGLDDELLDLLIADLGLK
jgi:subtilisin family serine protease